MLIRKLQHHRLLLVFQTFLPTYVGKQVNQIHILQTQFLHCHQSPLPQTRLHLLCVPSNSQMQQALKVCSLGKASLENCCLKYNFCVVSKCMHTRKLLLKLYIIMLQLGIFTNSYITHSVNDNMWPAQSNVVQVALPPTPVGARHYMVSTVLVQLYG